MQQAFPFVDIETPVELLAPMITPENPAVVVRDFRADKTYVLTGYDVLRRSECAAGWRQPRRGDAFPGVNGPPAAPAGDVGAAFRR